MARNRGLIIFLCWGSPYPPLSGGDLRTLGLLRELSKVYQIEMVLLAEEPLTDDQKRVLQELVQSITVVSSGHGLLRTLGIIIRMLVGVMPYHCAIIANAFLNSPGLKERINSFQGPVYASYGHWGTIALHSKSGNFILDQHNADVDFWRVYASQSPGWLRRVAALVNWKLAAVHFKDIYENVHSIVSVCEEDRQLTLSLCQKKRVDVIENGIDCSYYVPDRRVRSEQPRLLFTGTSAPRNMKALQDFVENVLPLIAKEVHEVELLVAGNFNKAAQDKFVSNANVRFTGRVDDIRPCFNQSDVYVSPFSDTHGSKLKIAEAMAMAIPIVSTSAGIRGFSLKDGQSVLLGDTSDEFASHVINLLRDGERRDSVGKAAREVALSTIDWGVLGRRLVGIVDEAQRKINHAIRQTSVNTQ